MTAEEAALHTKPTSTQIVAIAENMVANALMLESGGRLSPFSPVADDDGIDLLVYDKESGASIPVQIKSRTVTLKKRDSHERGNAVHFEIRSATFKSDRFAYLVAVLLTEDGAGIERRLAGPDARPPKDRLQKQDEVHATAEQVSVVKRPLQLLPMPGRGRTHRPPHRSFRSKPSPALSSEPTTCPLADPWPLCKRPLAKSGSGERRFADGSRSRQTNELLRPRVGVNTA